MVQHAHRREAVRPFLRTLTVAGAAAALLLAGCAAPPPVDSPAPVSDSAPSVERPSAPEGELAPALQQDLQTELDRIMRESGVPGAAVGVWVPGEGSWTAAAGLADVATETAVTTDMVWPIRSITKSYTVTLLLQLADTGELSLDDTISTYVDGVTNGEQITLLQLANMSSGIADYVDEAFVTKLNADPTHEFTLAELNSGALGQPAQFPPGTEFVYTNANTNLIGAVIERVTGQPYAQVLQERILDPLGQTGTRYLATPAEWPTPHPVGYQPDADTGELIPQEENPSILGPAGSLFSTLEDGRVWADTLGSGALLHPETQALREIGHRIPKPPYDLYAVGIGETNGWLGHNGEGVGFTAATFHNPTTGASIVVYMNESNLPDNSHPADQTFRAFSEVLAAAGS